MRRKARTDRPKALEYMLPAGHVEPSEAVIAVDAYPGESRQGTFSLLLWPPHTMRFSNARTGLARGRAMANTLALSAARRSTWDQPENGAFRECP